MLILYQTENSSEVGIGLKTLTALSAGELVTEINSQGNIPDVEWQTPN